MAAVIYFLILPSVFSQQIINNPEKPAGRKAGRVIKTRRIWQIDDSQGVFYFKYPGQLRVASDGSIFVADREELLKFSSDGRFLGNFYRKGGGPGEIGDFFFFDLYRDKLYVYDPIADKIIKMNLDGGLEEVLKLKDGPYHQFLGISDHRFVFVRSIYPPFEERKGALYDVMYSVIFVSSDGREYQEINVFRVKTFLAPQAAAGYDPWLAVMNEDRTRLMVNRTREYRIEVLDLEKGKISLIFNRRYRSVKRVEGPRDAEFRKRFGFPKIKYESDIRDLFHDGRLLWVRTSTSGRGRGDLIDLFDESGRFVDSFFTGIEGSILAVKNGFLYVKEEDEQGNPLLSKYMIMDEIR